jgi:hypothetical protein
MVIEWVCDINVQKSKLPQNYKPKERFTNQTWRRIAERSIRLTKKT